MRRGRPSLRTTFSALLIVMLTVGCGSTPADLVVRGGRIIEGERFYPDQRMSRIEAPASYTIDAAYAGFEENDKGSLAVGKLADIVILDQDITAVEEEAIPATQVIYTIVGGRVVFEAGKD